jgi:hypothetical protein
MRSTAYGVLLLLSLSPAAPSQTPAQASWEQFRSVYPYHVQSIALSAPAANRERLLIVAEPPPHVTLKAFIALDPALASAATRRRKIGYDGWVTDIVVTLPPTSESTLRDLVDRVHYYLYGTTYKAHAIGLPATKPETAPTILDLRVTTADLQRWIVAEPLAFRGLGDLKGASLADLLRSGREGVVRSDVPGLVAWILPRRGTYARLQREARQFALDSDLIAGGVADDHHFAILARERVASVSALPPLRGETIMLLADVSSSALAQSYERNFILAGKFDGQRDWAPIYLSDALVDTEYGSLLNLTDQLLKSWSMAGQVKYVDFPYPAPPSPFPFRLPLARMPEVARAMRDSGEGLTFNWNTHGAGYVDRIGPLSIYALNRTGALPISYMSGGTNDTSYEEAGYAWFASQTHDPNLARVVQYAALYQMFQAFRAPDARTRAVPVKQPRPEALSRALEAALGDVALEDCGGSSARETAHERKLRELLGENDYCENIEPFLSETGGSDLGILADVMAAGTRSESDQALVEKVVSWPDSERAAHLNAMSKEARGRVNAIVASSMLASDHSFRQALARRIPLTKARDLYVAATQRTTVGSIRTASVVVSWPLGDLAGGTGGHNLDAKIGRFVADPALKPGEIRVAAELGARVVRYSPEDRGRLPDWLRDAAVAKDESALLQRLQRTFKKPASVPPNRTLEAALAFSGGGEQRGLTKRLASKNGTEKLGWGETLKRSPQEEVTWQATRGQGARLLNVERLPTGDYRVLDASSGQVYEARSTTDLLDVVVASLKGSSGEPPTTLMMAGFGEGDAINLRRNVENWLQREASAMRRVAARRSIDAGTPVSKTFEPLSQHGDLSRASFVSWEVRDAILPSGRAGKLYETAIDIPPRVGGMRGLLIKVRLFFKKLIGTQDDMRAAQGTVKATLASLRSDATADAAAAALEKALRAQFTDFDSVVIEIEGLVTAEYEPPSGGRGRRSAERLGE